MIVYFILRLLPISETPDVSLPKILQNHKLCPNFSLNFFTYLKFEAIIFHKADLFWNVFLELVKLAKLPFFLLLLRVN